MHVSTHPPLSFIQNTFLLFGHGKVEVPCHKFLIYLNNQKVDCLILCKAYSDISEFREIFLNFASPCREVKKAGASLRPSFILEVSYRWVTR